MSAEWVVQARNPTHYRWLAEGGNWSPSPARGRPMSRDAARKAARQIKGSLTGSGIQITALPRDVAVGNAATFTIARSTGTEVHLYRPGVYENDPSAHWMLVCTDHGGCCGFPTRHEAEQHLSHPEEWCPTCKEDDS